MGRTQAARVTKYEFHGGVKLPNVHLPARSLHINGEALRAAGYRKGVRLAGRKLRQLVQIQYLGIYSSHTDGKVCHGTPRPAFSYH